uniref:dCTP pyrophosphatase 1 n=1 Tax=Dunaliella tertiolecta TaxID=3047 RepID=A0A6S8LDB8_DUNTE|mmetsp:Transcript_20989/g.54749  ORF Transcript_20989/g.54749 Transcript_20989/m.54749 type:complete len:143 (-) Transcript_20989:194-622(-)
MAEGCNPTKSSCDVQQNPEQDVGLGRLRQDLAEFARERDWEQFHSPRNLLLALMGEMGELSELFMWKGEVQRGLPTFTPAEKEHCAEELSDVLLYLCRLADICDIDLGAAALAKMKKNALKYPADKCRGSSAKAYTYASGQS